MTTTEQRLINTLRICPEAGFRMLMDQYQEPIYWHIRRLVVSHDDAQDATQETFVRIFRSMGTYQGNGSFRSWIYRIATNEALRCLSKRQEETVSLESETTGVTLIADNSLEEADKLAAKLQRAILTLSPKQQLAFNLRYYDELCFSEIARVADSTPTSIRQSYHVAKEKIIKYMNQND